MKYFLPLVTLAALSLGGCGFLASLEHGAEAEITTPDGKPLPAPKPTDNSTAYLIGAALAGAGLVVADKLTGGAVNKATIGGLLGVLSQHVEAIASSVPADVHAQSIQGLAQSTPVVTAAPVAPVPLVVPDKT